MLLVCVFLSALMMRYVCGYNDEEGFTWSHALLFGSIISATDPVAVVALLKELGASKRLSTLIEGESLLNDGTAMVVFLVLLDITKGVEMNAMDILGKFARLSFGGPALGLVGGVILSFILSRIHNNGVLEVNATIFVSYIIFYIAESTPLHVSGILALVVVGLYMSNVGKTSISIESEHAVHHVWGYVGFVAETIIFMISGIIIGEKCQVEHELENKDLLLVWVSYFMLHIIRFVSILIFLPCMRKMGYGMTFKQVILCSYAGLRGAVGISLALMVFGEKKLSAHTRDVILLHVLGVALLTLLINAPTTGFLVKKLGLNSQSDIKKSMLLQVSQQLDSMENKQIAHLRS